MRQCKRAIQASASSDFTAESCRLVSVVFHGPVYPTHAQVRGHEWGTRNGGLATRQLHRSAEFCVDGGMTQV